MRVIVLGSPDDARGFGLAGLPAAAPRDRHEAEERLARLGDADLVVLSSAVAALAPAAVDALLARPGGPVVIVLPGGNKGGGDADAGEHGVGDRGAG